MRNNEIDRLRGFAILLVIWHHLSISILSPFVRYQFSRTWTGVDLFFVISGYLVTSSFLKLREDTSGFKVWKTFVKRRFTRILPMAWLWAVIPLLLTLIPTSQNGQIDFSNFKRMLPETVAASAFIYNYFSFFTGLSTLGYYWSLAVEEHFYLLLPLILLAVPTRKMQIRICSFLVFFVAIGRSTFFNILLFNKPTAHHFLSHNRFDSLFLGVVLILVQTEFQPRNFRIRWARSTLIFITYAISIIFMSLAGLDLVSEDMEFIIFMTASGVLVFLASLKKGYVFEMPLGGPLLEKIGARSFSLYLIHQPAIGLAQFFAWWTLKHHLSLLKNTLIFVTLEMVLFTFFIVLITNFNYKWVELPLIRKSKTVVNF